MDDKIKKIEMKNFAKIRHSSKTNKQEEKKNSS